MPKSLYFFIFSFLINNFASAQSEGWAICNSGANLYFKMVGDGQPLLVVGDAGHSSLYMSDLIQRLSQTNKVIYFDARATGKSKLPTISDSTVNFKKAIDDIEGLRAVLRIPKWSVLAHGLSTAIVCEYAAKYYQNVSQLILLNPAWGSVNASSVYDPYFDTFEEYDFSPMLSQEQIAARFDALQQKLRTDISLKDSVARWKAILEFQAATFVYDTLNEYQATSFLQEKVKNFSVKRRFHLRFSQEPTSCLTAIRVRQTPVLVMFSRQRKRIADLKSFWKDNLPLADTVSVPKAHHFLWLDNPDALYPPLISFLKRVQPPKPPIVYASKKKTYRPNGSRH